MPTGGIDIGIGAALTDALGATAATALTTAGEGAALGAATSAATGGNPGIGALTGGITGGALGGLGGAGGVVDSATGLGVVGSDVAIGAGAGALGSAITGGNVATGALGGAVSGGIASQLTPSGASAGGTTSGGASAAGPAPAGAGATDLTSSLNLPDVSNVNQSLGLQTGVSGDLSNLTSGSTLGNNIGFGSSGSGGAGIGAAPGFTSGGPGSAGTGLTPTTGGAGAGAGTAAPFNYDQSTVGGVLNKLGITTAGQDPGVIASALAKNPAAIVGGGGLLYNLAQGNQPQKGMGQLAGEANQLSQQGKELSSYLQNGTLPAGAQAAIQQATNAAKATVRSQYAAMGQSGSEAEAQALNQVDLNAASQSFGIADKLLSQGISETQLASSLYTEMLKVNQQQTADTGSAIANFASSIAGFSPSSLIQQRAAGG